ncbi:MAG: hypothetical protein BAJALOKI3v1_710005 [Promethearchaeota archaeon]|nr:MAG: hypothetical protein BAJALOKI3v1_710005 [Candidatus Lokiarchaeota archaeon]
MYNIIKFKLFFKFLSSHYLSLSYYINFIPLKKVQKEYLKFGHFLTKDRKSTLKKAHGKFSSHIKIF